MKLETIPNETWVERHLRAMKIVTDSVCTSPESVLKYMVKAKMMTIREAKKYGYVGQVTKRKSKV